MIYFAVIVLAIAIIINSVGIYVINKTLKIHEEVINMNSRDIRTLEKTFEKLKQK